MSYPELIIHHDTNEYCYEWIEEYDRQLLQSLSVLVEMKYTTTCSFILPNAKKLYEYLPIASELYIKYKKYSETTKETTEIETLLLNIKYLIQQML